MIRYSVCFFMIISISFLKSNSQEKIYFPYFELINMGDDHDLQYATSKLLKTYIEENHDYLIILPKMTKGIYPTEDFLESLEKAKKYGAKYVLLGEINNIGKVAVLSLSLIEVSTGNRVWRDLIKSFPLEDFDPVLSRLGRNFGTTTAADDDAEIYDITQYEEEREMKLLTVQANHFTGVLLGGNLLKYEFFTPRIALCYTFDISSVLLAMDFEYSTNNFFKFLSTDEEDLDFTKVRSGSFGMGVILPVYKRKNSFYGNASFEFGATSLKRESTELDALEGGLGFYLGAGYLMGRTSTANIRYEIGFSIPTYKVNNDYIYELKFGIITSFATVRR